MNTRPGKANVMHMDWRLNHFSNAARNALLLCHAPNNPLIACKSQLTGPVAAAAGPESVAHDSPTAHAALPRSYRVCTQQYLPGTNSEDKRASVSVPVRRLLPTFCSGFLHTSHWKKIDGGRGHGASRLEICLMNIRQFLGLRHL